VCIHSGVGRSCNGRQLRNLKALVVSTAITCFLSVLTLRTNDESGKVQVATIAACVNIWDSSDVIDAYPTMA
jgi:hypothetical protein